MITVSVLGAERVARGLSALAARLRDLSPAWRQIGARMVDTAAEFTPVLTARLVDSLTARATGTDVVLSAGGGGIEYAGVQNYGWAARNIVGQQFLEHAAEAEEDQAAGSIEELLTATARLTGIAG